MRGMTHVTEPSCRFLLMWLSSRLAESVDIPASTSRPAGCRRDVRRHRRLWSGSSGSSVSIAAA